ncbi:hypothetical protein BDV96DRAFT_582884 [Lophiotrema nucula]|uniref:SnoaL-like domain-containing protein n=1 Tax=Lophiotrema nucula TaxID=690887 RepID=A0A6A5YWZ7_9PLEO|nr:hypothetical protein BDV96DRAFT_582884 [Lophiotrema nucula]
MSSPPTDLSPVAIVKKLLANATNPDIVNELVHPRATYVSLNYTNPQLHTIMPWCGTHKEAGPAAIIETFTDVGKRWENKHFEILSLFGGVDDVRSVSSTPASVLLIQGIL